jgi:ATP-binding cassette, subfamily B, bacterial
MNHFEEEDFTASKFDVSVWRQLLAFLKPLRKELFLALSIASLLALSDVGYPLLNRYGIDTIIASGDFTGLPLFIGIYVGYMIGIGLLVFGFIHLAGKVQTHLAYFIREKAFLKLHQLPYSYYDQTPVGWIMARMTSDSRKLSDILAWGLIDLTWGL